MNNAVGSTREITLTPMQIFIIMSRAMGGAGVFGIARVVSGKAKQDGWISGILATILIAFFVFIMISLLNRFKGLKTTKIFDEILGKFLGKVVALGYCGYFILVSFVTIRALKDILYIYFLERTPMYVIYALTLVAVLYVVIGGIDIVTKVSENIFIMILFMLGFLIVAVKNGSIFNILPIGEAGIKNIVTGSISALSFFSGYEVLFFYFYFVKKKDKILKYSIGSILYTGQICIMMIFTQIYLFGHNQLQNILFPTIKYAGSIKIPLIERLELFLNLIWMIAMLNTISIYYLTSCHVLLEILPHGMIKKVKEKHIALLLAPVIYYFASRISGEYDFFRHMEFVRYGSVFLGGIIPLFLFILSVIFKKGKKKSK